MGEITRIFDPDVYVVQYGTHAIKVKPLPAGKVRDLAGKLTAVTGWLKDVGGQVGDKTLVDAALYVIDQGLQHPFDILHEVYPEITREDVDAEPLQKTLWLLDLIIEVNGLNWAKEIAKNLLDQLKAAVPGLANQLIPAIQMAIASTASQLTDSTALSNNLVEPPITLIRDTSSAALPTPSSFTTSSRRKSGRGNSVTGT